MTKFYTTVLVMLAALQAHAQLATATFEDIQVDGEESFWGNTTKEGENSWTSGGYTFGTYYSNAYGYDYYSNFVVSNNKNTDGTGYTKPYQSTASGAKNGNNYAVFYLETISSASNEVSLPEEATVSGFWVCNNTYAMHSVTNGDSFAKVFGQGDYFKLTMTGYDANGEVTGTVDQMLVDCTVADNWVCVKDWRWVDLTSLGNVKSIKFSMSSSDTGNFGINTPLYFCMDDFGGIAPEKNTEYAKFVPNEATGINSVEADMFAPAVKKYENGKLVIYKNGRKFSASGVELK
ncbi:MAG: DUF4465 domain-containing protein [Bacteroidaceae bacterium]|nr:DUF4465 domain-containing protein [Bacteroidaceae bacterium]